MSLTNSVRKCIDKVLVTINNNVILPLLYQELLELENYVTIYRLTRSIHEHLPFVRQCCLVRASLKVILNYHVVLRDTYDSLRSKHTPLLIREA